MKFWKETVRQQDIQMYTSCEIVPIRNFQRGAIISAHPLRFLIGQLETHYMQFYRIGSTSALVSLFCELLSFGLSSGCQGEKLRGKETRQQ